MALIYNGFLGWAFLSRPLRQKINGLQQKCRNPFFFACLFAAKPLKMELLDELVELDDWQQHSQHDQHDHQAHRHDE